MNSRFIPSSFLRLGSYGIPGRSRNFTELLDTDDQHYTIPPKLLGGADFTLSVDFKKTSSTWQPIIAGTLAVEDSIIIDISGGTVRTFSYTGTTAQGLLQSAGSWNDGEFHTVRLDYDDTANIIELYIDDSLKGSRTWVLNGSQDIALIGKRTGHGDEFGGIIANVNINGERIYKIDENLVTSRVIVDSGTDGINGTAMNIATIPKFTIHILGDSFATSTLENALVDSFDFLVASSVDGVGGSTLIDQASRFDLTPEYYDDTLIIMDGGLSDSLANATAAIDDKIANLTHDNWFYIQPSPYEFIEGSAERIAWNTKVDGIIAHVGASHYIECLTDLKAGNDGSPNDLQDVSDNIVPRSLRTDTIHETTVGTDIRAGSIAAVLDSP